ncbi:MAG: alpha/beta hydrolase, partial [Gammaproteobacteria bacterium]
MPHESYFHSNNECYFMAYSELKPSRPTLMFIHGLGDAHIHSLSYLTSKLADHYNILIPDLLGHGKSSGSDDYRFQHQIEGLQLHINHLQKAFNLPFSDLILIAHSMGSIHATLLCESSLQSSIKGFINVEGSVTQYGSFIAENMMEKSLQESFAIWFQDFKQKKIYEKLAFDYISIRP